MDRFLILTVTLIMCLTVSSTDGSSGQQGHYLFFFPVIPKSAKITFMPVAQKLVERGHSVTVISPYPSKDASHSKLQEITAQYGDLTKITANFSARAWEKKDRWDMFKQFMDFFEKNVHTINKTLAQTDINKLWAPGAQKIDVIIAQPLAGNEVAYFLSYKLNATMVIWSSQQNPMSYYDFAIGQPHNPAYIGNFFTTFRHPMSFFERVGNSFATYFGHVVRDHFVMSRMEEVLDFHFPEDKLPHRPSLLDLETRAGLALQFGHPLIMDGVRPMAPNYINVGMMNCRPPKPLPTDLQQFMDNAGEDGVILVSFGSVLTASAMPEAQRLMLLDVFRKLKQKIVWKWETEIMPDKPDNLFLSKWLPQQDILGHPNLRLFVSHGGQSSCQESLCHKVPMVIVPVFGDQPANGQEAEIKGYGISIPLPELNTDNFYSAIRKVLDDPSYKNRAEELGELLLDDINKPIDRAIWWLEYALRHPGMSHLRSPTHELPWYQLMLLDVFAFLIVVVVMIVALLFFVTKLLLRWIFSKQKRKLD